VAVSQGRVLIPAALYAGAKLLDWFIPRFEVTITLDSEAKKLSGKVTPLPHGPYVGRSLPAYNKPAAWKEGVSLYIDGEKQSPALYSVGIERGLVEGDLKAVTKLRDSKEHVVELEIDLGGIRLKSAPARTSPSPAVEDAEPFRLTGSYITGPSLACLSYSPRDLGRLTNVLIAWSDYAGEAPVMTASGKDKGLIYLQERYNPEFGKNCWYFGLLIPPEIKPGSYSAEINYYLDHGGPFTVPVVIRVEGDASSAPGRAGADAQAYRDYLLSDVASRHENAAAELEKEKQVDLGAKISELRAGKAKRRAEYEQELAGLKKALENAPDEEADRLRREIRKISDRLASLDAAFQQREDDLVRGHERKMAALGRLGKELSDWESALRAAHQK
jgi:hypothetical protein